MGIITRRMFIVLGISELEAQEKSRPCNSLAEKTQKQLSSLPVGVLSVDVAQFLKDLIQPLLLSTYEEDSEKPQVFKIPTDKGHRISEPSLRWPSSP